MDVVTGYKRSYSVVVRKLLNNEILSGYPKIYPTAIDMANGYFVLGGAQIPVMTQNELQNLTQSEYEARISLLKDYVIQQEGMNPFSNQFNENVVYDLENCVPQEITTTTTEPILTTTTTEEQTTTTTTSENPATTTTTEITSTTTTQAVTTTTSTTEIETTTTTSNPNIICNGTILVHDNYGSFGSNDMCAKCAIALTIFEGFDLYTYAADGMLPSNGLIFYQSLIGCELFSPIATAPVPNSTSVVGWIGGDKYGLLLQNPNGSVSDYQKCNDCP